MALCRFFFREKKQKIIFLSDLSRQNLFIFNVTNMPQANNKNREKINKYLLTMDSTDSKIHVNKYRWGHVVGGLVVRWHAYNTGHPGSNHVFFSTYKCNSFHLHLLNDWCHCNGSEYASSSVYLQLVQSWSNNFDIRYEHFHSLPLRTLTAEGSIQSPVSFTPLDLRKQENVLFLCVEERLNSNQSNWRPVVVVIKLFLEEIWKI